MQGHVGIGALILQINLAGVKGLRIDVDADRALAVFGEVQHLVHRFERIDVGRVRRVHFVNISRNQFAGAAVVAGGVAILHTKILHLQSPDRRRHPAILVAMVVDAAGLADFPADGHAFKHVVSENQVARIAALGEEKVFLESFGPDRVAENVVLYVFESEIPLGDGGEVSGPIGDGELLGGELSGHRKPPGNYNAGGSGAIIGREESNRLWNSWANPARNCGLLQSNLGSRPIAGINSTAPSTPRRISTCRRSATFPPGSASGWRRRPGSRSLR